jgi:hypothetical protein
LLARGPARVDRGCAGALLIGLLACAGCAAHGALETSFPLSREQDLQPILARAQQAARAPLAPVVVGVRGEPRGVFAYDLRERRLLFSEAAEVDGVPVVAGHFVVVPEKGAVRLRALNSGRVVRSLPSDGMQLIGADGDGTVTAVVLSTGGSYEGRSQLVMLRGDSVVKTLTVKRPLGAPAVLGGLVFVPHSRVHLSVLSPEGDELARVRVRDDVASEALTDGRQVFFGLAGIYLLDPHTPAGVQGGAHYFAPDVAARRKLPGAPAFLRDTTEPPAPVESAVHRIQLKFWPTSSGSPPGVGLANDALYLSFYRLIFGLDENAKQARWVRTLRSDAVGMQAGPNGLVVVEERGAVSAFDAEGRLLFEAEMGAAPIVASVRTEGLGATGPGEPMPSLVAQLSAAALDRDTRLAPGAALAARALAQLPERDATSALIEICGTADAADLVREAACTSLAGREGGIEPVLGALARHSDFLAGTRAAPLPPLAAAAASSRDARAGPLLFSHLEDPATDSADLPALAKALSAVADASLVPRISQFVRLYHADTGDAGLTEAVITLVHAIATRAPASAADLLEPIANDEASEPNVRGAAQAELSVLAAAREAKAAERETAAGESGAGEPKATVTPVPARLTSEHLGRALAPLREKLSECFRNDPAHPLSARLTVIVEGDGQVVSAATLPESLEPCVEPLVRSIKLPATRFGKRDTLHYALSR